MMLTKIFLEALGPYGSNPVVNSGFWAFFAAFAFLMVIISILLYVYSSFIYMKIAQKAKYPTPGFAWIPLVGPVLISSKLAKMHWWPVLLLIGAIIPVIGFLFSLAFSVFFIIWTWKIFESFGKPGWISVLAIIPFAGAIVVLVFLSMIAFDDSKYVALKK